ncbi:MAG: hypothetical protein FWD31_08975 [Planctomycetaceae bacterium]|nr:hypothetical protein [Planctomycetaceae bacterium]
MKKFLIISNVFHLVFVCFMTGVLCSSPKTPVAIMASMLCLMSLLSFLFIGWLFSYERLLKSFQEWQKCQQDHDKNHEQFVSELNQLLKECGLPQLESPGDDH